MKTVILCGGQGMRLREETDVKPKPMVQIGDMPILWHLMKTYARHGFKEFVLCLGYKGHVIREYFYNYEMLSNDFTVELGTKNIEIHPCHSEHGWKVTLVETGLGAMTGARVKRAERYVDGNRFMLTYGDAVSDIDLVALMRFHEGHGKIATLTGVCPPSRYGELVLDDDRVVAFREKPPETKDYINGGYFVFERQLFDYLDKDNECVLERAPLERLAADGQLRVYPHHGFWQCMDTYRDYRYLNDLWDSDACPWKTW